MNTLDFLKLLWPNGIPDGARIVVASPVAGSKAWRGDQFNLLNGAAAALTAEPNRYLTLAAMRPFTAGRGKAKDAVALPCFWLDLDTLEGTHKKTALPKDEAAALALVSEFPLAPSCVLHSGGGIYCFWMLHEPLLLPDDRANKKADTISQGWQELLLSIGKRHGYDLDQTGSLASPLRAPGCLNGKYDPPRHVRVLSLTEPLVRYRVEEIVAAMPARTTHARQPSATRGDDAVSQAASMLGGAGKAIDNGVVLRICPACQGLQSDGSIVEGTAHLTDHALTLKCKRESCVARGDGLSFETWGTRFLAPSNAVTLRAQIAAQRADDVRATQFGIADAFQRDNRTDVRWCPALGGWLVYDGKRWRPDDNGARLRLRATIERAIGTAEPGSLGHLQTSHVVDSALKLAAVELEMRLDDFDADAFLLNVENGTVDLRTGTLRPHRREDMISKLAPCIFELDAKCEDLERFLDHVTGGSSYFRAWLGRAIGYTATADMKEDALFVLHGPQGNEGKSTLLGILDGTFGEYARTVSYSAVLAKEIASDGPRPELATLPGARLIVASEAPEDRKFDSATIKSIAGGDSITVHAKYGKPFTFRPVGKLWLACNKIPGLPRSDDGGMRRRIHVVPFAYRFAEEGNRHMRDRLRTSPVTRSALLAMAVRGCLAWQHEGLGTCEEVARATATYLDGQKIAARQDALLDLFLESCEFGPAFEATSQDLQAAVARVAQREEVRPVGWVRLAAALRVRGCEPVHGERGNRWRGVRLKPEAFSRQSPPSEEDVKPPPTRAHKGERGDPKSTTVVGGSCPAEAFSLQPDPYAEAERSAIQQEFAGGSDDPG